METPDGDKVMAEKFTPVEPNTVACDVCLKDIPETVAKTMEGEDYIHHFCGLDCYKKWQDSLTDTKKAAHE